MTAYKCRAYPDDDQAAVLRRTFGCIRVVWNRVLDWRTQRYRMDGIRTGYAESDRHLTELKRQPELSFLNEVSSVPLQQTLRHQHAAFTAFFTRRARYPRWKSHSRRQSATYTRSAFRWRGGRLFLAKMTQPLRMVWSWPEIEPAMLDPSSVTVSLDPDGMWHVTLHVDVAAEAPMPATGDTVGIDVGIKNLATTSDGDVITHPRLLAAKKTRLARYQRMMSRKQRGSKNRAKARRKVAKVHGRVRRARQDFLHKTTTSLVRRYDTIVMEDLDVSAMAHSRSGTVHRPGRRERQKAGLNRAILDSGWFAMRTMLGYKTAKWGKRLVVTDRWFPSSKTCSSCGFLLPRLGLSTRAWSCPNCGVRHDRDVNAAKNILAEGLSVTACGADVSRRGTSLPRSAAKQERQPARAAPRR
jgi:putative transposase